MKRAAGSYGSKNGLSKQDYRRESKEGDLLSRPVAGVSEGSVPPSQDAIRTAIAAQTCPWCGKGPYKVLAVHTNKTHGVSRVDLREMAGYGLAVSICSEEFSESASANSRKRHEDPEYRDKLMRSRRADAWVLAVAKSKESRAAANRPRRDAVVELFAEGKYKAEIARALGMREHTVAQYLKEAGIHEDTDAQLARRKEKMTEQVHAGARKHADRMLARRAARFRALGGSLAASSQLADEENVSIRKMRQYLRKHNLLSVEAE